MRLRDNIHDFLVTPARFVRAIEYMLSTATVTWGILLAAPPDIFGSAPSWMGLRETWLSEVAWGLLIAALGLIKLLACWKRWQRVRQIAAIAAAAIWSGVGLSFFSVNSGSPGWSPYVFLFAALNALTFLRLTAQREA